MFVGIYMSLFGLPGTVVIFTDVLAYAAVTGFDRIGFKILLFLLIFSVIGEMIDFLMGITDSLNPLPSKRLFFVSALSAIAGSCILTPFFLGLGAFGGFFLGCFAGIMIMEFVRQTKLQAPFKASNHAVFVMIGGKMVKGCIALVMIALSLANIYS
jgi:uncharacterized protein